MSRFGKTEKSIRDTLLDMHSWYEGQSVKFPPEEMLGWNRRFNQLDDLAHLHESTFLFKISDCGL